MTLKNDCHSDFMLKGLRVVSNRWMMETVRIKYYSINMLTSLLRYLYRAHAAVFQMLPYLLKSNRGEDTLNICLFCHASRQGASLFAVHPLIYQMSTVGLVQFHKEQSWLSSWVPRKTYLKESDATTVEKQFYYIYIHPSVHPSGSCISWEFDIK